MNKPFIFEEFIAPYKEALMKTGISRYYNYEYVINKLVAKQKPLYIVETGTMWSNLSDNMGAFTLVFSDLIQNWTGGKLYTIDISEKSINSCRETTKKFSQSIEYIVSDSVSFLESLSDDEVRQLDYVYFDSYDLFVPDPVPSQLHHYRELSAIYKRLSPDVILSVDDNYLPGTWIEWHTYDPNGEIIDRTRYTATNRMIGKGTLIDCFLLQEGWKRVDDFIKHAEYDTHMLTYEAK